MYGTKCLGISAQKLPPKGYAEGYHDNTCILAGAGDSYLDIPDGLTGAQCLDGSASSMQLFQEGVAVMNNTIYAPQGDTTISCGGKKLSMAQFQELGYDKATTVHPTLPSASTIVGWAKALLLP